MSTVEQRQCQPGFSNSPAFIRITIFTLMPALDGMMGNMSSESDPKANAQAALKLAASSFGAERLLLIRLALAWQGLAREQGGAQFGSAVEELRSFQVGSGGTAAR